MALPALTVLGMAHPREKRAQQGFARDRKRQCPVSGVLAMAHPILTTAHSGRDNGQSWLGWPSFPAKSAISINDGTFRSWRRHIQILDMAHPGPGDGTFTGWMKAFFVLRRRIRAVFVGFSGEREHQCK